MEDTPTSCHQARDQVLERVTGTTEGKVNLLPMTIDLVDPSNSNTHSVEQFAVELQKRLPKPEGAPAPPIHVVIYAANDMAPSPPLAYLGSPKGVESHVYMNHLVHALLTHHLWKNIVSVHEQDPDQKARLVTVSTGWNLFPVDPAQGWYTGKDTVSSDGISGILDALGRSVVIMKQYIRSKRAQLFFAAELQAQYSDYITTGASHAGCTRCTYDSCHGLPTPLKNVYLLGHHAIGMSPAQRVQSIILAALDDSAQYVGPKWFFFGPPVVVSRAVNLNAGSVHHQAFSRESTLALFDTTMELLSIAEFGRKTYQTM